MSGPRGKGLLGRVRSSDGSTSVFKSIRYRYFNLKCRRYAKYRRYWKISACAFPGRGTRSTVYFYWHFVTSVPQKNATLHRRNTQHYRKNDRYLFLLKSAVYLALVNTSQMFLLLLTVYFYLLSTLAVTWALLLHRICRRRHMLTVLLQRLMHVLMRYIDALSLGTPVFWCGRI